MTIATALTTMFDWPANKKIFVGPPHDEADDRLASHREKQSNTNEYDIIKDN
jgi:hypothetical protein